MTRIHRNEFYLKIWLSHYSRYFNDLVVFAGRYNGREPSKFEELNKQFNFTYIDLEDEFYNMNSHQKVFDMQKQLFTDHTWVLYSDADEIVVADPLKYDGLRHYMDVCLEDQTFCEGYEVFQAQGEGRLDLDKPILKQRNWWVRDHTKSYHKPALSRIPTNWAEGFHYIKGKEGDIEHQKNMGLYLLHLKYVDLEAEMDFPRETTGTHGNSPAGRDEAELIPEHFKNVL